MIWSAWAQAFFCWPVLNHGFTEPKLVALLATVVWIACRRLPARAARPILACYAAMVLSWWFSINTQVSLYGLIVQPSYGLLAVACYATLLSYAHISPVKAKHLAWLGAALGAFCVFQRLGFDPYLSHRLPSGRAIGWMGSPVDLGATLAMLLAFCGQIGRASCRERV